MIILGIRANDSGSMVIDSVFDLGQAPALQEIKARKKSLPIASLVELPTRHSEKLLRKGQLDRCSCCAFNFGATHLSGCLLWHARQSHKLAHHELLT
jgi:hypothetical protein